MIFSKEDIIAKFYEAMNREQAIQVVEEATNQLHISGSGPMEKDDALLLFETLKNQGGVVKIIVNFFNC